MFHYNYLQQGSKQIWFSNYSKVPNEPEFSGQQEGESHGQRRADPDSVLKIEF